MAKLIMVVEDEIGIRELLIEVIEEEGSFNAVGAGSGLTALNLLKTIIVDLITLDLNMPIMDGNTFLSELSKVAPLIPVIVVSATPKMLNPNKQVKASIGKPFDIEQLLLAIQRVCI